MNQAVTQHLYQGIQRLPPGSTVDQALFTALRMLGQLPFLEGRMKHIGGRIHYAREDYRSAEHWLSGALEAGRKSHSTYNCLGRAQAFLGNFDAAEANLQAAIDASPDNDGYHLNMAEALRRQGKHDDMLPYLHRSLEIKPTAAWNHFCLFQNELARLGAAAALDNWLDRLLNTPGMEEPLIYPDWWLVHRRVYTPEREKKTRELLAQHPTAHHVHLLLAYLLRYSDNPADGIPHLQAAARHIWEEQHGPGSGASFKAAKPPAFLVMGVAKSGSSALYKYLCMHPLITPALAKEINYWSDHHTAGPDWYQACFPPIPQTAPQVSGEASIKTFWYPEVPERIARECPGLKLILILREPAARAFSHFKMNSRLGREQRSWEECVDEQLLGLPHCPVEEEELPGDVGPQANYLMKGAVLPVLKRWLRHHDKEKILILDNRDLDTDTTATMNRVFRFLDLPEHDIIAPQRINVGGYKPLSPEMHQRLQAWYRPHQEQLAAFLEREFS